MALAGLGSNPGLEGSFRFDYASGHAMRLNSRTGPEGLPMSSLNCARPLHSGLKAPEFVMDAGCRVEVCMGIRIPIPTGLPWNSHANESSFGLLIGNGNGNSIFCRRKIKFVPTV